MLTIMIIFTLLVALWGQSDAIASARAQRARKRRHGAARESSTRIAPPIASSGH